MPQSSEVSVLHDSLDHLRGAIGNVADIYRHEGLKRHVVERALFLGGTHHLGRWAMEQYVGETFSDPALATNIGGLELGGPVGIAAGWDKTGKSVLGWQALGAGHVTVGGVTLFPQAGNPMPRLYTFDERVGDHGKGKSLNSYGFYNPGADRVVYNLEKQRESDALTVPIIVQVTINKEFYKEANRHMIPGIIAETVRKVKPVADAINLGLSSPNTLGMRDAQSEEFTYANIMAAKEIIGDEMPLGYKGDADGGEKRLDMYCQLAVRTGLDYLELINTTALAHIKERYGAVEMPGGIAGADAEYQQMAIDAVRYVYEAVGDKVDIMGMGGINSVEQAAKMIRAGASAIGVNTAVRVLGGKAMIVLKRGLPEHLNSDPDTSLESRIGVDTRRGGKYPHRLSGS